MKRFLTLFIAVCLCLTVIGPISVWAEDTGFWYDGTTVIQNEGTITFNGTAATFSCDVPYDDGGSLGIKKPLDAPNKEVDVEFKLQIEGAWTTREIVAIYSGAYRAYIGFRSNGIYVIDVNSSGRMIECNLGKTTNSFRVRINKDGLADFYMNGRSISKDFPLQKSTSAASFDVSTYGGNGGTLSQFTISDVVVHEVEGSEVVVTSGDPPSLTIPPTPFFYDFTEEEDLSEWRLSHPNRVWIDTDKGVLAMDHPELNSIAAFHRLTFADDFILEHRLRFQEFADFFYYKVHYPGGVFHLQLREARFHTEVISSDTLPPGFLLDPENPDEWHTMKFESYGGKRRVKVYIDDVLIGDYPTEPSTRPYYHIQIGAQGMNASHARMEYDWIRYTPVWAGDAVLATPLYGDEYLEGEPIHLGVHLAEGVEADQVEYKLNGSVVAVGTKENNYQAVLNGVPAGSYFMTVVCNGKESSQNDFTVAPARKNQLNLKWAEPGKIQAELAYYDELPSVKSVEYQVNGASVATIDQAPFAATLPASSTEGSSVVAVCKDGNGTVLEKLSGTILPDLSGGNTTHYSNEITYEVSGNDGSAAVDVSNGTFQVKLNHTPTGVTYLTDEGEKALDTGAGRYTILTDGPFTEIYYNGKLAAGYRLPRTQQVTKTVTENGMSVKDFTVTIPDRRQNYFVKNNVTDKNATYYLPGLDRDYAYNVDFMASKEDEAAIVVNDSLFRSDLELRDGKIYVQTAQALDSEPYEYELCDMKDGETHYRIATSLGMTSVFADGKFIGSYRNVRAVSDAVLGINVISGDGLAYLNVNDYSDIFLYQDDFSGGDTEAIMDYWYAYEGMTSYVDSSSQSLVLVSLDHTDAIAEIYAHSRQAEMGADITVEQAGKDSGFWLMANRPTTSTTWTKAGYNFATKEFEIADIQDAKGCISKVSVPGNLEVGETVHMEIKIEPQCNGGINIDKKVTLYVNGEAILSKDSFGWAGTMGFISDNCVAKVRNFSYRGNGKPVLDVRDSHVAGGDGNVAGTTVGNWKDGDRIYSAAQTMCSYTDDMGKSWYRMDMKELGYPKLSVHMLRLNSGELLSLYKNEGVHVWGKDYYDDGGGKLYQLQFWMTEDPSGLSGWEPLGYLLGPEPELGHTQHANTVSALGQSPDGPNGEPGRLFYVGDPNLASENVGDTYIWSSDDKGLTWNLVEHITYEEQGYSCMQEPQVVATKEFVRVYYRNDRGMLRYFESLDNGTTWDHESKSTPFFAALNCFGAEVVRKTDDAGNVVSEDIYVTWSGDSQNLADRFQFPRTNYRHAKSSDYGETWEFIGSVFDNSSSKIRNTNLGLYAFEDCLITGAYSYSGTSGSTSKARVTVTPLEKQVTTMRDCRLWPQYESFIRNYVAIIDENVERCLVMDPDSGAVLIHGMRVENGASQHGIGANYAAGYVGATLTDNGDGTVTLSCGTASEIFQVVKENGNAYIPMDEFAKRYGLNLEEIDGVTVISPYDAFTWRGQESIVNAVKLF